MKSKLLASAVFSMVLTGVVFNQASANTEKKVTAKPAVAKKINDPDPTKRTQVIRIENFLGDMGPGPIPTPGDTTTPVSLKFYNGNDKTVCYNTETSKGNKYLNFGYPQTNLPGSGEFMWTGYSNLQGDPDNNCYAIKRIDVVPQVTKDPKTPSYMNYTCYINENAKLIHVMLVQVKAPTYSRGYVVTQGTMKCIVSDNTQDVSQ